MRRREEEKSRRGSGGIWSPKNPVHRPGFKLAQLIG